MQHTLALIEPLAPSGGHRLAIRVCSADLASITGLGNKTWEPALTNPPKTAFRLFGGEFGGSGSGAAGTRLGIAMQTVRKRWPDADKADWSGAKITIYRGQAGDGWPWKVHMVARVTTYSAESNTLSLNAAVDTEPFDQEFPTATYAGTDEAEGPADLKGRVKPLIIGHARNVEPVLIDAVDNVYQFSAYGPIEAVETLFERGSDFGASQGDYASYAALVAADVPEGSWATCLDEGMIRLGAPAFGTITANVRGHEVSGSTPRLPGAIISALADIAGVDSNLIDAASLAAMDTAAPYENSLVLTQGTTLQAVAQQIAAGVNHVSGIGLDGRLFAARIAISPPAITLHAQGAALPLVTKMQEQSTSTPYSKIEMGAARNWRVQALNEMSFAYRSLGPYSATRVYRVDDVATGTDGRAFVYINATPAAGQALPGAGETSNSYWNLFGAADVTAQSQRVIEAEFGAVEIRQYEAGNSGDRTVGHFAKAGSIAIGGGTWSLSQTLLGEGSASVNSGTGLVTLSGISQSGSYTIRYTHTDALVTELKVNVTFIAQEATVRAINASPTTATWFQSSTTSRTVNHSAVEGSSPITGGTWTLESTSAGVAASINSSTGAVTISNVTASGNYRVRYTHTDTVETELVMNVTYYPASDPSRPTDPNYNEP